MKRFKKAIQPSTPLLKSPIQSEKEQIDNYDRNIQVLVALTTIYEKFGGDSIIGRKLKLLQEDRHITPDLVTEMTCNSAGYGILSESKVSLPKNQEYWKDAFEQLKRYDKEIQEWSLPPRNHDIVLVTDSIIAVKLWEYTQNQNYQFTHKIAILQSHREDKVQHFIDIQYVRGDRLTHQDLSKALEYTQRLPLQNIFRQADAIKFYDDRPPTYYIMGIIWQYVASAKIPIEEFRKRKTFATMPVDLNIDELLEEMRSHYAPSNNPTVLKKDWIKEALDEFVKLGLAKKKEVNNYEIDIRKPTKKDISPTNFLLNLRFIPKKNKDTKKEKIIGDEEQITIDKYINKDNSLYPSKH